GEGCAAIVLKPLSQALIDNDGIECVTGIQETGGNSNGRTSGITTPSAAAHNDAMQRMQPRKVFIILHLWLLLVDTRPVHRFNMRLLTACVGVLLEP
ncbi:hypothetical protein BKA67DRAFT_517206, partial [Truncatella angustata]